MSKLKLALLFGGRSSEYEISLASAHSVISNIDKNKYDLCLVGITKDGKWYMYSGDIENIRSGEWCRDSANLAPVCVDLATGCGSLIVIGENDTIKERVRPDIVFPVLHGSFGEDGTVQGVFELAGIPVVGCASTSSGVCMDKEFTKHIVSSRGIRQASCVITHRRDFERDFASLLSLVAEKLGFPVFVKPARAGSSVGITKVKSPDTLQAALTAAFAEDEKVLIEEAINGREVEVAILEENGQLTVSECGEIDPGSEFYDYDTKYVNDTASYFIPARIPADSAARVRDMAAQIFTALDCKMLARVDFFVTPDGEAVFNEINTLPGFTSISMYPKLMQRCNMSYSDLLDRLAGGRRAAGGAGEPPGA